MNVKELLHRKVRDRTIYHILVLCSIIFFFPSLILYNSYIGYWFMWSFGCCSAFIGASFIYWLEKNKSNEW